MPEPSRQSRHGLGRRRTDWRWLRIVLVALVVVPNIVWGVATKVLFDQLQHNRASTTGAICRAVDATRIQTRDGFHSLRVVARNAGLRGKGLTELHEIVETLNHPPANQNCHRIVVAIETTTPPRAGANP